MLASHSMKAIRVRELGDASVLRLETTEDPTPGPGEVLVRIEAAGINFIDVYYRTGLYKQPPPYTPGSEAAGTVVAIGSGVENLRVGDRVASTSISGAYAELARAPANGLVRLPDGVSSKQGAAAMLQGMTAHYLACTTYPLSRGDTCVVHAAAGGVGLLLCQIAKLRGATVIATVSTDEKAELAKGAGADHVIFYTKEPFEAEVKRLTDGVGANVIYDGVGKSTFEKDFECIARRGMIVLFGQSSGPVAPFEPSVLANKGSLFLTRPVLGHYIAKREELEARSSDVFGWIRDGKLSLRIGHEFPLAEAAEAHRALESRKTTGKVLLLP